MEAATGWAGPGPAAAICLQHWHTCRGAQQKCTDACRSQQHCCGTHLLTTLPAAHAQLAKLRQAPPTNLPLPTPRIVEGKPADNGKQEAQLQSVYASRSAARLLASHAAGLVSTVAALL